MGCTGISFTLKSSFSWGRAQQLLASPWAESRTGSQSLGTCRKGKAKLKARDWDPLRARAHLWPHWVSLGLEGFSGTAPGPQLLEEQLHQPSLVLPSIEPCSSAWVSSYTTGRPLT